MRVAGRGAEFRIGRRLSGRGDDYGRQYSREDGVETVEEQDWIQEDGGQEVGCSDQVVHVGERWER